MAIYLYIKQHSITNKLYFGKTMKDPLKYYGSGIRWTRHLKKHGKEHVETLWYELFADQAELTKFALEFSEKMNIVESDQWLNLKPEDGLMGGATRTGHKQSEETKRKISKANKGRMHSEESKLKQSLRQIGIKASDEAKLSISIGLRGKLKSEEHKANMRKPKCEEHKIKMSKLKLGNKNVKGLKTMHDPITEVQYRIHPDKIEEKLKQGLVMGMSPSQRKKIQQSCLL